MPDLAERLEPALALNSREWSRWLAHCRNSWPDQRTPSGAIVARELCTFLALPSGKSPLTTLKAIQRCFQISDGRGMPAAPGEGWAKIGRNLAELPLKDNELLIKVGDASAGRAQFVRAHEVAHFFFAALISRLPEEHRDEVLHRRSQQVERFCWEFASELLCPEIERRRWTAHELGSLLRAVEQTNAAGLAADGGPPLTYWHVRALAGRYRISVRAAIAALDHAPVLNELVCGIAVFRYAPNQWTGRETTHRVWQVARPIWGHLVLNQRASKQGFEHAAECYDNGKNQITELREERLLAKCKPTTRSRWQRQTLHTVVAYTPVDV